MLRGDTTGTFLENVSTAGGPQLGSYTSYSHGWAAAPTSYLTTKVLGVEPDGAGFSSFTVTPQPGSLQWAEGAVPTPHGTIAVAWKRTNTGLRTARRGARRARATAIALPGGTTKNRLDRHDRAGGTAMRRLATTTALLALLAPATAAAAPTLAPAARTSSALGPRGLHAPPRRLAAVRALPQLALARPGDRAGRRCPRRRDRRCARGGAAGRRPRRPAHEHRRARRLAAADARLRPGGRGQGPGARERRVRARRPSCTRASASRAARWRSAAATTARRRSPRAVTPPTSGSGSRARPTPRTATATR